MVPMRLGGLQIYEEGTEVLLVWLDQVKWIATFESSSIAGKLYFQSEAW